VKKNHIAAIVVAVVAIGVAAVAYFVLTEPAVAVVSAVIGAVVAVAAFFILRETKVGEAVAEAVEAVVPKPAESGLDLEAMATDLLELNVKARSEGFPSEISTKIEQIIDGLIELVPQLCEKYPAEDITYEFKRIAAEHLSKLISEWADQSAAQRVQNTEAFSQILDELCRQVDRARELVEHQEQSEFAVMAMFLKTKYAQNV